MTKWTVRFEGFNARVIEAETFMGAVREALRLASVIGIPEDKLIAVEYLAY